MRAILLIALLLPACGNLINLGEKAKAKRREEQLKKLTDASVKEASGRLGEKASGEIAFVDTDNGYALIRVRNGLTLEKGQELECRGSSGGRLRVTPERKNMFVAADIVSGSPQKGDSVIPVKGSNKTGPKLVPVAASPIPGTNVPANTISVDPSTVRPESIPRTTLDEPGGSDPANFNHPALRDGQNNMLVNPPLPEDPAESLLPPPKLSE